MRTRSKTKRTRENLNRLPREVEATLPSWVKCTDPIPREILEEVRSTVLTWMKNVRNYVEETETYILNDEHAPPEVVDDEWAFVVEKDLCFDPHLQAQFFAGPWYASYAEGVRRFAAPDALGRPVRPRPVPVVRPVQGWLPLRTPANPGPDPAGVARRRPG